ncbi:hypothetical protein N7613_21250 [Pseudomonas juntendi]|uniref:hypothetical protein n=1 Tax=Pseudomonas juntendi TaxID=2666183 RepID=UPI00244B7512|nr:hypothetical protein [Pseudomonas juntendi]MDG9811129.1 hypothetical protein [Pseudomonas juntendi]
MKVLMSMILAAVPLSALSAEPTQGADKGVSLYLNTQQAFSEAGICHAGSRVVARVADARLKGASREQVIASFGKDIPKPVLGMVDAAFAYSKAGPDNAEDYYRACSASAIERMNAANKKAAFPDAN